MTLRSILTGHRKGVRSIAFSPDGKTLASGSEDCLLRLWDAKSGDYEHTLCDHNDWVRCVAFSPDGKLLASASDDATVRLWSVDTGQFTDKLWHDAFGERHNTNGFGLWKLAVTFSRDGKTLACGAVNGTFYIRNAKKKLCIVDKTASEVWSVAFSPNGKTLASSSGRHVRLWNLSGESVGVLSGHSERVYSVAFAPDGKTLASGSLDESVIIWDLKSHQSLSVLRGHTDCVNSVAFSPNGKLIVSASDDGTLRLWNFTECVEVLKVGVWISSVAFSPNGKILASGSGDCAVRLWSLLDYALLCRASLLLRTGVAPYVLLDIVNFSTRKTSYSMAAAHMHWETIEFIGAMQKILCTRQ